MTTVRDLINDAYRLIGVVAYDETAEGQMVPLAKRTLNRMLRHWDNYGHKLWAQDSMSVTLTTAISYTLASRVVAVENIRLRRDGIDTPMESMTRDEYDAIPQKTSTGLPTGYHYSRRKASGILYIWPGLATVDDETLEMTVERELEEADALGGTADTPDEWGDAVLYNLAARLAPFFPSAPNDVRPEAAVFLAEALAADSEGSVFFYACD